jgi:hypothetical protein
MQGVGDRFGPSGRPVWRCRAALSVLLLVGLAAGACTTDESSLGAARPGTIAFESIDGPPPATSQRLVQQIERAAQAHNLAVVSHEAPAQFRVRGYLSARVERSRTSIAWVWDVYDVEQQRALRIRGEQPGGRTRDWAAADESVLRHIADDGMDQLAELVGPPAAAPAAAAPTVAASGEVALSDGARAFTGANR